MERVERFEAEADEQASLDPDLPRGYVDPRHALRIISAIVSNAREAMDEQGVVEIFTGLATVDESSPHFEVPFGDYIRIGIRDSGRGMDAETRRRCFEPFFTTKDVDPGTGLGMTGSGLGLAAAYALARRNGGRLVVESRPGYGSLFTLYVPVADSARGSKAITAQRASLAANVPLVDQIENENLRVGIPKNSNLDSHNKRSSSRERSSGLAERLRVRKGNGR